MLLLGKKALTLHRLRPHRGNSLKPEANSDDRRRKQKGGKLINQVVVASPALSVEAVCSALCAPVSGGVCGGSSSSSSGGSGEGESIPCPAT